MQVERNVPSSFETFKKVAFFNPFIGFYFSKWVQEDLTGISG